MVATEKNGEKRIAFMITKEKDSKHQEYEDQKNRK